MAAVRLALRPLRDAGIAALLGAVIGLPLIGLRLADQAGGEVLVTRWPDLGAAVALVFLGRFALGLVAEGAAAVALVLMALVATASFAAPWPSQFLRVMAIGGAAALALYAA